MKRKNTTALLAAIVLTAMLLAPLASVALAGEDGRRCRFEGAWSFRVPPLFWFYETVTSLDSANNSVAIAMSWGLADPTLGRDEFQEVTRVTPFLGEGVRIGRRTFQYKIVSYGVRSLGPGEEIVYIRLASGVKTFSGDCRSYEAEGSGEVYLADSDGDGDGLPDPGSQPLMVDPPGVPLPFVRLSMD